MSGLQGSPFSVQGMVRGIVSIPSQNTLTNRAVPKVIVLSPNLNRHFGANICVFYGANMLRLIEIKISQIGDIALRRTPCAQKGSHSVRKKMVRHSSGNFKIFFARKKADFMKRLAILSASVGDGIF